jgi:hypothetical protein
MELFDQPQNNQCVTIIVCRALTSKQSTTAMTKCPGCSHAIWRIVGKLVSKIWRRSFANRSLSLLRNFLRLLISSVLSMGRQLSPASTSGLVLEFAHCESRSKKCGSLTPGFSHPHSLSPHLFSLINGFQTVSWIDVLHPSIGHCELLSGHDPSTAFQWVRHCDDRPFRGDDVLLWVGKRANRLLGFNQRVLYVLHDLFVLLSAEQRRGSIAALNLTCLHDKAFVSSCFRHDHAISFSPPAPEYPSWLLHGVLRRFRLGCFPCRESVQ